MHLNKTARVVIGAQFGDEGKGRLTAHHVMEIGDDAIMARFNGGATYSAMSVAAHWPAPPLKGPVVSPPMSWLTTRSVPRSSFRLTLPHRRRVRRAKLGAGNAVQRPSRRRQTHASASSINSASSACIHSSSVGMAAGPLGCGGD